MSNDELLALIQQLQNQVNALQNKRITQQDILPSVIKPQMLASTTAKAKGDIYYSDGTNFQRLAAGASGKTIVMTTTSIPTWGNGKIPSIASATSSATPAPNSDTADQFELTAQAATAAFQPPSGSPSDGQKLMVQIKDNGTARALSWSSATGGYTGGGGVMPTSTVTGKYHHISFQYVTANSLNLWLCLAAATQP